MPNPFLTGREALKIRHDWKNLLLSPNAVTVTLRSLSRQASEDEDAAELAIDPVYHIATGGEQLTVDQSVRAIMQIVEPNNQNTLKWEVLKVGDAIFYLADTPVVAIGNSANGVKVVRIVDADGQIWTPVLETPKGLYDYLRMKLGVVGQVAQVIPCRLLAA